MIFDLQQKLDNYFKSVIYGYLNELFVLMYLFSGGKVSFFSFDLSHLEFFMYEKGLKGSFAFN